MTYLYQLQGLVSNKDFTTNIRVKGMVRWLQGKIGQYARVENPNSPRGMWQGSRERTSVDLEKLTARKAMSPS
jgi:hypothetical protein